MTVLDFKQIKRYYDMGAWTKKMVWNSVKFGKITAEEYELITGDKYTDIEPIG